MEKNISKKIIDNKKLFDHLKEQSFFIKWLNRDSGNYKMFVNSIKNIYKETPKDKINNVIDNIDLISSVIDTLK